MKILLTGSTGVIGSRLKDLLESHGHVVIPGCRPSIERNHHDGIVILEPWSAIPTETKFDCVMHLANFYVREEDETSIPLFFDTNVGLASSLANFCSVHQTPLISVGTFLEESPNRNWSLYAESKRLARSVLRNAAIVRAFTHIHIYLYDTYSADLRREKFIDLLLAQNSSPKELKVKSGSHLQDLTHVDDVCEGLVSSLNLIGVKYPLHRDFQIRSREVFSLRQLVDLVNLYRKPKLLVTWEQSNIASRHIDDLWDSAEDLPKWQPGFHIEQWLRSYFDNTRQNL